MNAPKDPKKGSKPKPVSSEGADQKRAARNVAKLRAKLSEALDDPNMREQIVHAMRSMMYEDKT